MSSSLVPLRLKFPGAFYHVAARDDRRESIFEDDEDRVVWLALLEQALSGQFYLGNKAFVQRMQAKAPG